MFESYRFRVKGRVQGVFFRQSTCHKAVELGLRGWVQNLPDGSVEGCAAGEDAGALRQLRQWLHSGPPRAEVNSVEWDAADCADLPDDFEVRR